jgi:protein-disulfide isomerase
LNIHLPSIGIGIGAVIAVVLIVFFVLGQGTEKSNIQTPVAQTPVETPVSGQTGQIAQIHLLIDNASPILGSKNAPITMIEFGDYQCF